LAARFLACYAQLQCATPPATISFVKTVKKVSVKKFTGKITGKKITGKITGTKRTASKGPSSEGQDSFSAGALVLVTLGNPREKFWGMVLALGQAGLSLSGVELASLEDLAVRMKDGDPFTPVVVFFPMHRVERVELDSPNGSLPSLSQRFLSTTGMEPAVALVPASANGNDTWRGAKARAAKEQA
jgi:hypothetical protein